ncbi:MAG: GGDEF domain-containing protein [Gammaproteobacteria bacterium]|nr:GGDEF domain-containing protein [Gammaproteobacteria bacterium]
MTTATLETTQFKQPRYDRLGNLALALAQEESAGGQKDLEKALRISGILQTSLEVKDVIEIFAHQISRLIKYDHLQYINADHNIDQLIGTPGSNAYTYRLVVSGQSLGEIIFSRGRKFSPKETNLVETLLCGLVYPLRNALLYRKALDTAYRDPLTGAHNRAAWISTINREIGLAHRYGTPLALLALDIDHFKKINDTFGHTMGDCVIRAVVESAAATIRSSDMVFRYGGEEFLVLLSNTSVEGASLLAERLRQKIADTTIICDGVHVSATVSIGVSYREVNDTPETLFVKADKGLYMAKNSGRNSVKLYTGEAP